MSHGLTELEQAAMMIVLETPRRAGNSGFATTAQVRRELVKLLERALRNSGHGDYLDKALRHVRDRQRKDKAESDARIAAYKAESESDEAKAERKATYQAAMKARAAIAKAEGTS